MTATEFDLEGWAARHKVTPLAPEGDDLLGLTDREDSMYVTRGQGVFLVETTSRGTRRTCHGAFSTELDAVRWVIMTYGQAGRSARGLSMIRVPRLADGAVLTDGPDSTELSWSTGSAEFSTDPLSTLLATEFSWLVTSSLAAIAESYDHPQGRPVFAGVANLS